MKVAGSLDEQKRTRQSRVLKKRSVEMTARDKLRKIQTLFGWRSGKKVQQDAYSGAYSICRPKIYKKCKM